MRIPQELCDSNTTTFGMPAADYITLTTFDANAFKAVRAMTDVSPATKDRFRGYEGWRYGGLRMLVGEQLGRAHFIMIGEGDTASWLIEQTARVLDSRTLGSIGEQCKCTRLDVQVSVKADQVDFRSMRDELAADHSIWRKRGKAPSITLIEGQKSDKGLGNTLYIGSRKTKNGNMTRIYEKADADGVPHLRYEVELKGKPAHKAFTQMMYGDWDIPAKVVSAVISTLPINVVSGHLEPIAASLGETDGYKLRHKKTIPDDINRVLWFRDDVAPSLSRLEDSEAIDFAIRETTIVLLSLLRRKGHFEWLENMSTLEALELEKKMKAEEQRIAEKAAEGRADRARGEYNIEQGGMFDEELMDLLMGVSGNESYYGVGL